jgi:hypothetical protein
MSKNWIQGAIKHPGALRARAEKHGISVAKEMMKDAKTGTPTEKRQAALAKTLMGFHHKKGK